MSDLQTTQAVDILDVHLTMLLPDTLMMLTGESFANMLPAVSYERRGAKKQWDGGYTHSIRYTREEIEADPFLALSPQEYKTLRLHMQGLSRGEIARILGITEVGVGLRLQKNRVKVAKARLLEEADEDLSSLVGEALDVYRTGLKARDLDMKMKAADRIMKFNGKGQEKKKDSGDQNMSPAEFMGTLLKNIDASINVNVGLNDYERPTTRTVDGHTGRVLDAEYSEDSK